MFTHKTRTSYYLRQYAFFACEQQRNGDQNDDGPARKRPKPNPTPETETAEISNPSPSMLTVGKAKG